ncbi:hypothetical protein Sru01_07420 [Sphaerisporangium rufum]|uniref:VapC45 PIN like domain-containing protein n=1 Tax=Sphaerisporangium rufum TaxID=1381558 RepID=A0A919QZP1_9ACTN|nr:hypothetical protein [Sphaerisporangium rufum]GII75760.1 hypothetical protein Sru01_07420 [Sphaerisporangium rufum]
MKHVTARWYIDADALGLAHVLIRARRDVTFCGDDGQRHHKSWTLAPCLVQDTATPDDVWIPRVAGAGLAIITRDKHISMRTAEKNAVLAARARMFAITSDESLDAWGMLEVIVTQWRHIEKAATRPGPYIYAVTRSGIREIALTS